MTSQRKIQTNRANAQKSSGPKTAAGKHKASANSRKHGFASVQPSESAAAEGLARVLCGGDHDDALLGQARIVAENHLLRRAIRERKLNLIERQMTPSQIEGEYVKQVIDKLLVAIFAKFPEDLPPLSWFRKYYESEDMLERVEEYFDGEDLVALRKLVKRFLHREPAPPRQVGEFAALELAGPEIDRLERYESRAWTRQMRATRSLMEIKRSPRASRASRPCSAVLSPGRN
jgi:hypothetical protein